MVYSLFVSHPLKWGMLCEGSCFTSGRAEWFLNHTSLYVFMFKMAEQKKDMLLFEGKVVRFAAVLSSCGSLFHSSNHTECSEAKNVN